MNLSKDFQERVLSRLTHHDLYTIDIALQSYMIQLRKEYRCTSQILDHTFSKHAASCIMQDLCWIFDKMCDVRTVQLLFEDIRFEDYKTKVYEIPSGS